MSSMTPLEGKGSVSLGPSWHLKEAHAPCVGDQCESTTQLRLKLIRIWGSLKGARTSQVGQTFLYSYGLGEELSRPGPALLGPSGGRPAAAGPPGRTGTESPTRGLELSSGDSSGRVALLITADRLKTSQDQHSSLRLGHAMSCISGLLLTLSLPTTGASCMGSALSPPSPSLRAPSDLESQTSDAPKPLGNRRRPMRHVPARGVWMAGNPCEGFRKGELQELLRKWFETEMFTS